MWLHNFLAKNSYDAIFQKVPESSRTRQNRINSEHVYNNVIYLSEPASSIEKRLCKIFSFVFSDPKCLPLP